MSIHELTDQQVREWTLKQKDEWWLKNVFKGDMPQLNLRSAITGMCLGGILSLTNLYVGIRTGWALGVGLTSVILSYSMFKVFATFKIGREMTVLENNAMQSIATSAGYMTAPLIASMPAYMMVTGHVVPMWQTFWWIIVLSLLGVLFAFPLKRRFINDEQLPFPEGRAAGIVLDNLHGDDGSGMFKAKILLIGGAFSALLETLRNATMMTKMGLGLLIIPEEWDEVIYHFFTPSILGTSFKDLTIQFDSSIVMMGTGGLMNMKSAMSLLLGAFINYFILAPIMIQNGIIHGVGFKAIASWALWVGAAMMTTSSLYSFFSKPQIFVEAFRGLFSKQTAANKDPLKDIELPMWIFAVGIPVIGAITVYLGHEWFGVDYWLGLFAIPFVFVLTLIAVTSTGLTAITPGSALGQLTQVTYSVLAPGNIPTNLMTAGMSSEVALNASNLLMDIKPGYMLGGKPRHQALGHILGIFAGAIVAVPVFYSLFNNDISLFTSKQLPLPSASVWKAVSEVLAHGISSLHPTAQTGVVVGALLGIIFEVMNGKMKGRFPLSGVGMGLAFILPFTDSLAMALGALIFWIARRQIKDKNSLGYRSFVENHETICAGVIAGGSIIGIILMVIENVVLAH